MICWYQRGRQALLGIIGFLVLLQVRSYTVDNSSRVYLVSSQLHSTCFCLHLVFIDWLQGCGSIMRFDDALLLCVGLINVLILRRGLFNNAKSEKRLECSRIRVAVYIVLHGNL